MILLNEIKPGYFTSEYQKAIAENGIIHPASMENLRDRVEKYAIYKNLVKLTVEGFKSSRVPLLLFMINYLLLLSLTILIFGLLIKHTSTYTVLHEHSFLDFLLVSILQFFNSDISKIFNDTVNFNHWVLATENIVSYLFFVLALLAFSSSMNQSSLDLNRLVFRLAKKHYNHFAKENMQYILLSEDKDEILDKDFMKEFEDD